MYPFYHYRMKLKIDNCKEKKFKQEDSEQNTFE